ncbi:MAG TPA: hypothetical protein VHF22_11470, partial [Planctomycetota bacterium]|nr:hypothetical protein [Planctomycetota bacterium]
DGLTKKIGEPEDYKPEHFQKVVDAVRGLPNAGALADRAPTQVGTPIAVNADIRFLSESGWTSVDKAKVQSALQKLGVAGTVQSFSPEWLNQNQATNITALVSSNGKTQVVSLGVDSEGVVRTAAKLDLDMARKLDDAAHRLLDGMTGDFADGALNPGKADPGAIYDAQRKAGKSFAQALSATFDAMVGKVKAGSSEPSTWDLQSLNQMGLFSNEDLAAINAAVHRAFP